MRIKLRELKHVVRSVLAEIIRDESRKNFSEEEINRFVDWGKKRADNMQSNDARERKGDIEFQWSPGAEDTAIIVYDLKGVKSKSENDHSAPVIGYISIEPFHDGHSIGVIQLKKSAQGRGIGQLAYDYIIEKTKLYSGKNQTPEARKLWLKLFDRYNVVGYDIETRKTFKVKKGNGELESQDPDYELYTDEENTNTCLLALR